MTFQRARRTEQKAERRAAILRKARELSSEFDVMGWSMNELGRRADVTKSNLYRYFGSREEILLTLMLEEMNKFVEAFETQTEERVLSASDFTDLLATRYCEAPLLCDLLSISSSLLEHNTHLEAIREIKLEGVQLSHRMALCASRCLKGIDAERGQHIAFMSGVIVAGLWPMASPNAPVRALAKIPGLEYLSFDFEEELQKALCAFVIGIQSCSFE